MPSHISHLLFAEDTLAAALPSSSSSLLAQRGNLFRFGAQGPDFFYHNQRTRPTGLKYGVATHREGYGRLVAALVREVRHLEDKNSTPPQEVERLKAYVLGFATHGFLDRWTHPFIVYFSGWVDPRRPDTEKYFRSHIFFERILDVLLLARRRDLEVTDFPLLSLLSCGPRLPYPLVKSLLKALNAAYPQMQFKSRDRRRIENAYADALQFYSFTDPGVPENRLQALERDRIEDRRRLAFFHPLELPQGIDFLNERRRSWRHPCLPDRDSTASLPELFEAALIEAVPALRLLAEALEGRRDPSEVERVVGNASLNTGLERSQRCALRNSDPLPLPEILQAIYAGAGFVGGRNPSN
jgi:hypothetical protein